MILGILGTLVTITALLKPSDIGVTGEFGEPFYTDRPINNGGGEMEDEGDPFYNGESSWPAETPFTGRTEFPWEGPDVSNTVEPYLPGETQFPGEGPAASSTVEPFLPGETQFPWEGHDAPSTVEPFLPGETQFPLEGPDAHSTAEPFLSGETQFPWEGHDAPSTLEPFPSGETQFPWGGPEATNTRDPLLPGETPFTGEVFISTGNQEVTTNTGEWLPGFEADGSTVSTLSTWPHAPINNEAPTVTDDPLVEGEGEEYEFEFELANPDLLKCCDQAVCTLAMGEYSECDYIEGGREVCFPVEGVFGEIVGITTTETTHGSIEGICTCKLGYRLQENGMCANNEDFPSRKCCRDQDCELLLGVYSECGNREGGSPEVCSMRPKREAFAEEEGFPGDTIPQVLQGECICKTGYSIVSGICQDVLKCCDQAVCTLAMGEHSECDYLEGGREEVCFPVEGVFGENVGITTTETTHGSIEGICMCKPGYWLQESGMCANMEEATNMKCCTDQECEPLLGVNSECGNREGGNPEVCFMDEYQFRPKREVFGEEENFLGVTSSDILQGECICKAGYSIAFETCQDIGPFDSDGDSTNSSSALAPDDYGSGTTLETGSSSPLISVCYDWQCSGNNCTDRLISEGDVCPIPAGSACYVSKQCGDGLITYLFGCEDPCTNQTTSGSRDCFTVSCISRNHLCNGETSLVDDFQCNSGRCVISSINILLLLIMATFN